MAAMTALALLLACAWLFRHLQAAPADGLCINRVISRSASPDGRHQAWVFTRDCGATTGESVQVSVLAATQQALPDTPGQVLRLQTSASAQPGTSAPVQALWQADGSLVLLRPGDAEVIDARPSWDGITIHHQASP